MSCPREDVAAPSISGCIEQKNDRRPIATRRVAARFRQVAVELDGKAPALARMFEQTAWRLVRCAQAGKTRGPFRCGNNFCPRCARQRALGLHKRLAARLYERAGSGAAPHGFALLTIGVAASNARRGVLLFKSAWTAFFRRRPFRQAIAGAEAHIQAEPARGDDTGQRWNIHAHAIVELNCAMADVDLTGLQATWAEVLERLGGRGSLDLQQRRNLRPEFFTHGNLALSSRRELRHAQAAR
jgi:hypothetical protein